MYSQNFMKTWPIPCVIVQMTVKTLPLNEHYIITEAVAKANINSQSFKMKKT